MSVRVGVHLQCCLAAWRATGRVKATDSELLESAYLICDITPLSEQAAVLCIDI